MPLAPHWRSVLPWGLAALVLAGILTVSLRLSREVKQALREPGQATEPVQFVALPNPAGRLERWGGGEVAALALGPEGLITAGGFGVAAAGGDLSPGLPGLRMAALTLWRGRPVVAPAAGGLFLRRDGHWEEARHGFGLLEIRVLLEGPGGELLVGARQGLFRIQWGGNALERLDGSPVRALALGPAGTLLSAGETGLRQVEPSRTVLLPTPDPWVEWVGFNGEVGVLTPLGLARGPLGGPLLPLAGGQSVVSAALVGDQLFGVGDGALFQFQAQGRPREDLPPAAPRRVFAAQGLLFVDTPAGLYQRGPDGWILARPRPPALPPGPSHVNALALLGSRVGVGLFDGGLALGEPDGAGLRWRAVPGAAAWGVNALLPAGGALTVASLRGVARFDGRRLTALTGQDAGGAFALAATRDGVAIGFGQGVLLPGSRLVSAFHGLPGNQALALAAGAEALFVGTPSGLGAVVGSRVAWRVTAGDGLLPHPWVTALALVGPDLFVGTYGGGVTRRTPPRADQPAPGGFANFPETQGFKINPGCLLLAGGRLYLGTDGRGLFRLSRDGARFVALNVPLPSPRVSALLAGSDALWIGTDEGLARLTLPLPDEDS